MKISITGITPPTFKAEGFVYGDNSVTGEDVNIRQLKRLLGVLVEWGARISPSTTAVVVADNAKDRFEVMESVNLMLQIPVVFAEEAQK